MPERRPVALVTGGTRGFGEAIAYALARDMDIAITGRDLVAGERVRERLAARSATAVFIPADVTDADAMQSAVSGCVDVLGSLDVAVNNIGVAVPGSLLTQSEAEWELALATNLTGVWRSLRAELPVMLTQGYGSVINVSSIWGLRARPGMSAYVATKHAVNGLTKAAALEVAAAGIRVNAVCPGAADTDMARRMGRSDTDLVKLAELYPMARLATGADVAGVVRWLASDEARFVTGQCIAVDGGLTV